MVIQYINAFIQNNFTAMYKKVLEQQELEKEMAENEKDEEL